MDSRKLLVALLLGAGSAWAGPLDDALAAYDRKDYATASRMLIPMATRGVAEAQFTLGLMYFNGHGVMQDYAEAVKWHRKAAEQGNVDVMWLLGNAYDLGRGVPVNKQEAVVWFRRAAEQGDADAQLSLGFAYDLGHGVPVNKLEAVVWYRKAAEQGNADAQYKLGSMYSEGKGLPKDDKLAFAWFLKAAEQGLAVAQINLGFAYLDGRGTLKDDKQAVTWFRKAAEQGDVIGQYGLGVMYSEGKGLPKDDKQAFAWFLKSAEQGYVDAQYNLGVHYKNGESVPKDEQLAYFWWLLASAQGSQQATQMRDLVERRLSSEQRANAQAAARNWQPKTAAQSTGEADPGGGALGGANPTPNRTASAAAQADSTGSGFRVARGVIVTNHHVIDGCSRLSVNGTTASVSSSDKRSDLALLGSTLPGSSVNLRAKRAAVGEPVAVAGFPLRGLLSGFNMTTGNLSSLSGMGGDTRLVQITAPVQPGNSGGPMLDSAGNLMGIVVSKLDAIKAAKLTGDIPQNVNFAINVNVLRSFLDANGVDYNTASSEKPIATTAIAERARGFTVIVECWK